MALNTPSPVNALGQTNAEVLAQERVYAGEVLSAFAKKTMAENFVHKKTLNSGISMKFPIVGVGKKEDVKTHTVGEEISLNTKQAGEVVITLNQLEYDSVLIDNKEKKILDYDITSPFTKSLGQSLADKLDYTLFGHLRTAVETLGIAGQPDGSWIANTVIASGATAEERGNAHIDAIFLANANMDENNVPAEGRLYITTAMAWYDISQATKTRSKDFTTKNGGIDGFSYDVIWIGNTMVMKSNNLTLTDNFIGYLFTAEAIGLVTLVTPITESTYQETRFANLITARYCYGSGVLNAGLVIGVRTSAVALP